MAAAPVQGLADIDVFLKQNEEKELLRLSTAGSVDDGKSTLIGRLLYDSKGVYEDQLASVRRVSTNLTAGPLDFALITDGLRAEREQGITIDVAYRYFSTPKRKFIIADTPGHEQYTRNMATGASTADLAVILVDARNGVLPQSRRHAFIAALLGIPHVVVAVNKMDLVGFREEVFLQIRSDFGRFAEQVGLADILYIPISALAGDNVVDVSQRTLWYGGPSLLEHLETVSVAPHRAATTFRFPVQTVIRPHQDFRGFAGQVVSGTIAPGDDVTVLPSGRVSRLKSIVTYDGNLPAAFAPLSVTLCLEDEVDVSRGDMLVRRGELPHIARAFTADLVWMTDRPLDTHREYLLKHTTQNVRARVQRIRYRIDVNTLAHEHVTTLRLNEIAAADFETARPLFFDAYRVNRATGAFILIDPITNETVAAGMIRDAGTAEEAKAPPQAIPVSADERLARYGHSAAVLWTAGDELLATALERELFDRGCMVCQMPASAGATIERLLRAGLLVISTGADRPEVGVDAVLIECAGEAAADICTRLERRKILTRRPDAFTGGGGI
jgi:sulfate adenylyltransferase large subunit